MCKFCTLANAASVNPFSDEEIDKFIDDVWKGINSPYSLPKYIYTGTAESLSDALRLGMQIANEGIGEEDIRYQLAKDLQTNVYRFSAAKTYQQTKELNSLLVNQDGVVRTFWEYKKAAREITEKFNNDWLRAEWQRAATGSANAVNWQQYQRTKDVAPYLQYQTAGDQRVRPTHAELDNIIRKVDDHFWDSYLPPNGWNCRCTTIQLTEDDATETDLTGFEKPKDVPDEFLINTGKQRMIYSDRHPYYVVEPKDIGLAVNNFNLPLPNTPTDRIVGDTKKDGKNPI
jgi:SPP1 gp7 family putative phage head morphogenesis protein